MVIYKGGPRDTFMVILRIPSGVITLGQLKLINELAKKYAEGKLRFTTRRDIQLHLVKINYLDNVIQDLLKAGLIIKFSNSPWDTANATLSDIGFIMANEDLKLTIDSKEENLQNAMVDNKCPLGKKYENTLFLQKQFGYYSLYVHPQNGNMSTNDLNKIIDYLATLNYEVSIRVAMTQGFFISNLEEKDLQNLVNITSNFHNMQH